jgi:O-antigen ligase
MSPETYDLETCAWRPRFVAIARTMLQMATQLAISEHFYFVFGYMKKLLTIIWTDIQSRRVSDFYAILAAISLPWSTTATAILMGIWIGAFILSLDLAAVRRETFTSRDLAAVRKEIFTLAGGLPLLLFVWAALGMLWADTTWTESFVALSQFYKLLFIPVLLAYFRRSKCGMQVIVGFVASCIVLLMLSLIFALWPEIQWGSARVDRFYPGVPVKSYITQSAEFAISAFGLFYLSVEAWKARAHGFAIITAVVAFAFIGDIIFVATSRIELIAIAVLTVLFGARLYGWKGALLGAAALGLVIVFAWNTSSYLRTRIDQTKFEIQTYRTDETITSIGYHVEFLRKSIDFIAAAPLIGHGTGSIKSLFEQSAIGKTGVSGEVTSNPHNQIFAVAIQLGLIGAAILCVMWATHLLMFTGPGMVAWLGLVIVIQNIVGSLVNAHLFDFTEGWIYVCGVGVLGGARGRDIGSPFPRKWSDLELRPVAPKTG